MNVKFISVAAKGFKAYASTYKGYFVHLTEAATVNEVKYPAGLYFGGESGWEYLTNDTNVAAIEQKIKDAVNALDAKVAISSWNADTRKLTITGGVDETDGKVGVTNTNSAVVYNADGVDSLIAGARTFAETEDARLQVNAGGKHTHAVSASGTIAPNLTPTAKHITASATAPTVTMSDTKFITELGTPTKEYLVTDTIAANGMVTNLSADKVIYNAEYNTANECLDLTPVTLTVTKNSNAITYATGASTTTTSSTASFVTSYSKTSSAAASVASVTKPTITLADTATSGGVVLLQSVEGATTTVNVSGTATEAGEHNHTLSKKTA